MSIIGLCGNKGSGKDTIADYLIENYNFKKLAFADFIKNALKKLFDWDDDTFNHENKEKKDEYWDITPREMCQQLGTEFLRIHCKDIISTKFKLPNGEIYHSTYHIKRINQEVIKILNQNPNTKIVFSDVRFQDELDYIKKLDGIIIRINRPNNKQNKFNNHLSEQCIDILNNIDIEIENNLTIQDLNNKVNSIIETL